MKRNTKNILIAMVMIGIIIGLHYVDIHKIIDYIRTSRKNPSAPFIFIGVFIVGTNFGMSTAVFSLLSGSLFGIEKGILYSIIATNISCTISFFIGKLLDSEYILKKIKAVNFLGDITEKVKKNAFTFILYLRFIPVIPTVALNFLGSVIGMKFRSFFISTLLGSLPESLIYVYLGYTASNIKDNPKGIAIAIGVFLIFTGTITYINKKMNKNN